MSLKYGKEKLQGGEQSICGLPREINVVFYWGWEEGGGSAKKRGE